MNCALCDLPLVPSKYCPTDLRATCGICTERVYKHPLMSQYDYPGKAYRAVQFHEDGAFAAAVRLLLAEKID
jgi:hypothetical protein